MEEISKIELRTMDEEFFREVRHIKSITAVHGNYQISKPDDYRDFISSVYLNF